MSLAEVKETVAQLTDAERRELESYLHALNSHEMPEKSASAPLGREEAMEHVFSHYGDLLRRLAQ